MSRSWDSTAAFVSFTSAAGAAVQGQPKGATVREITPRRVWDVTFPRANSSMPEINQAAIGAQMVYPPGGAGNRILSVERLPSDTYPEGPAIRITGINPSTGAPADIPDNAIVSVRARRNTTGG